MLSVIIPVYNYDISDLVRVLRQQISQLELPIEVLICDDASTSANRQVNKNAAQAAGFDYFENENNKGRTATRAFLANKASYDHLLLLDADVLPKKSGFLKAYLDLLDADHIICGGVEYQSQRPADASQRLRWKYGIKKEVKTPAEREEHPHTVVFANLALPKTTFQSCNPVEFKRYGLDLLFSECLRQKKFKVKHIDNPAFHLGLETNDAFLDKSKQSIATTIKAEQQGLIAAEFRPIQRAYRRLKRFGLVGLFRFTMSGFNGLLERNLKGSNPNIFLFDLYRLAYYIKVKNET